MYRRFCQCVSVLVNSAALLSGGILLFQFASVSYEVIARQVFDLPTQWVIYANEWGLLYIAFLGAAWLQKNNGQVNIDLFQARMGATLKRSVRIVTCLIIIGSSLVLLSFGTEVTLQKYHQGAYDFFKVDTVPLYLIYLVIPVGSALLLLQGIVDLLSEVFQSGDSEKGIRE